MKIRLTKRSRLINFIIIILALLALPLALLLVKQRQEIRKEAVVSSPIERCRVWLGVIREEPPSLENDGTYSVTFQIKSLTIDRQVSLQIYRCVCPEGDGSPPGQCHHCEVEIKRIQINPEEPTELTISIRQSDGAVCGSFQADVYLYEVEGNDQCYREGPIWGSWTTGIDWPCPSITPTPTEGACDYHCLEISVLNEAKEIIDPSKISVGQTVYFITKGRTNEYCSQDITKAKFRINGGQWEETVIKDSDNKYYLEYTILTPGYYKAEAMVYCSDLAEWR